MDTIYVPHKPRTALFSEPSHPTVKVVWCGDHYRALEGSHRCAAAELFGYTLNIEICQEEEIIDDHDIQTLPAVVTAAEIMDELYGSGPLVAVSVVDTAE